MLVLGFAGNVRAVDTIQLSYGSFEIHYNAPLEMEQAVEYCSTLNGRLPRFNNDADYDALGSLHLTHNITHSWVSAVFACID